MCVRRRGDKFRMCNIVGIVGRTVEIELGADGGEIEMETGRSAHGHIAVIADGQRGDCFVFVRQAVIQQPFDVFVALCRADQSQADIRFVLITDFPSGGSAETVLRQMVFTVRSELRQSDVHPAA